MEPQFQISMISCPPFRRQGQVPFLKDSMSRLVTLTFTKVRVLSQPAAIAIRFQVGSFDMPSWWTIWRFWPCNFDLSLHFCWEILHKGTPLPLVADDSLSGFMPRWTDCPAGATIRDEGDQSCLEDVARFEVHHRCTGCARICSRITGLWSWDMDSLDMVCHFWGTKLKHSDSWSCRFMMLRRKIQVQCKHLKITWTLPSWFYTFEKKGTTAKNLPTCLFPIVEAPFL